MIMEIPSELRLEELCAYCQVTPDFVYKLIEYGAIVPIGFSMEAWRFDASHLQRIHQILRLQKDLELDLPGALLALDLIEQIKELKSQVELFEKHIKW